MTQRGPRLRRELATLQPVARRHTARLARLAQALLLPAACLLCTLSLVPSASAAAPPITRTRTVKSHHEPAQPIAAATARGAAKRGSRDKYASTKSHTAALAASREPATASHRKGQQPHASAAAIPAFERGGRQSRHALAINAAPLSRAARRAKRLRQAELPRRGRPLPQELAEHRAADPRTLSAGVPRAAVAGGELTMDDFLRVASASAAGTPMAAATNTRTAPPVQRVAGFGAEGAVLRQPAADKPSTDPTADTLPDAVVDTATAGDSRVRALVHPSHEEMAEEVSAPIVLPGLYRNGRLVVPAPMKGSHDILVHQNTMADDEGLERVRNEDELQRLRASRQLVDFPESASLHLNPELGPDRRCARVWTVKFAQDTARAFYARFHEPLQVNSAVRTIAYQLRLQRTNGNAAGISGEASSPHLTGQAIDFGKRGMSVEQIAWMRAYLGPMMAAGKVDVEEEFQQACFHISVYKSYLPQTPATRRLQVATITRPTTEDQ